MKILILVTILCALPSYSIEYPAGEIEYITPLLANYRLPITGPINNNNSNTLSVIEQSGGLHVFNAASYPNGPIIFTTNS
ncbi:7582_t:CDS:1, partial [Dentiscutata erythropus]